MFRIRSRGAASGNGRAGRRTFQGWSAWGRPVEGLESRTLLAASLVKDINLFSDLPDDLTNVNGNLYLNLPVGGLAKVGMPAQNGSATVSTFLAGASYVGGPSHMTAVGSRVFFTAFDQAHGAELWVTDGTSAHTTLIDDLAPGAAGSNPSGLTALGSKLVFQAAVGGSSQVYVTDGTAPGTEALTAFGSASASIGQIGAVGGRAYFIASVSAGTTTSDQLWETDGTAAGTALLKDFGAKGAGRLTALNPTTLLFTAPDGPNGPALWVSDGSSAGTTVVRDLAVNSGLGGPPGSPTAPGLAVVAGTAYFSAITNVGTAAAPDYQLDLWKTDGTARNTAPIAPLRDLEPTAANFTPTDFIPAHSLVYFAVPKDDARSEIWRSDGTTSGTTRLAVVNLLPGDAGSGRGSFEGATLGDAFLFTAGDISRGFELWRSDGTVVGTAPLDDINPGPGSSFPQHLTTVGGNIYFTAHINGLNQLWISDGTVAGTRSILGTSDGEPGGSIFTGSGGGTSATLNGKVFFTAGVDPWISDGTDAGTTPLPGFGPRQGFASLPATGFTAFNGKVYFSAIVSGTFGFWASDGTTGGTVQLLGDDAKAVDLTPFGGNLYFSRYVFAAPGFPGGNMIELDRTDGTVAGTTRIASFAQGIDPNFGPRLGLTVFNGKLYFGADPQAPGGPGDPGVQLWQSDGTPAGTTMVTLVASGIPGAPGIDPRNLTAFDGQFFFTAADTAHGRELWVSDGTSAGTHLFEDLFPGPTSSSIDDLTVAGNTLFFLANDGTGASGLFATDGTLAGARRVEPGIGPPPDSATILGVVNNSLVYYAIDGIHGDEPWITDGTPAGTHILRDINPGPGSSYPSFGASPRVLDGKLYFSANDGLHGSELWRTDGTAAGTALVNDINYGSGSSNPIPLGLVNGRLLVGADDGVHGSELMSLDPNAVVPSPNRAGDYFGTGQSDLGFFLPETSTLYVVPSAGSTEPPKIAPFANPGGTDVPVAVDIDGDGKTDLAVFNPTLGRYIIIPSGGGPNPYIPVANLGGDDLPVVGDYFGTGRDQLGFFLPETSTLYVLPPAGSGLPPKVVPFANPGGSDVPVSLDFDGDGKADFAVFNPALGAFLIIPSGGGPNQLIPVFNPGGHDVPVVGDYYGTGESQLGFFVPETSSLYVVPPPNSSLPPKIGPFANPGGTDVPVAVDIDGDGKTDLAVFNPTLGAFLLIPSGGGPNQLVPVAQPSGNALPVLAPPVHRAVVQAAELHTLDATPAPALAQIIPDNSDPTGSSTTTLPFALRPTPRVIKTFIPAVGG